MPSFFRPGEPPVTGATAAPPCGSKLKARVPERGHVMTGDKRASIEAKKYRQTHNIYYPDAKQQAVRQMHIHTNQEAFVNPGTTGTTGT